MTVSDVQYITDDNGRMTAVIVPLELWRESTSERETAYLLNSPAMRQRLLDAMHRMESVPLDEVRGQLGC